MVDRLKKCTLAAVGLTYIVILLGAYTRLRDAGLGCPDWPGCYGELLAPTTTGILNATEISKAWIEMIHRYVAGSLGILILYITFMTLQSRNKSHKVWPLACSILLVVILQALLGMWTVTLGLYPIVVVAHLLGGFTILTLSWLLYLNLAYRPLNNANCIKISSTKLFFLQCVHILHRTAHKYFPVALGCRHPWRQTSGCKTVRTVKNNFVELILMSFAYLCLIALIMQIALGGWTSANYAALVCADFPSCQGSWWPPMDIPNAFNLAAAGIFDSPGTPLANTARVTIQMAHRLGALVVTITFSILFYLLYLQPAKQLKKLASIGVILLVTQLVLGITNVLAGLPLVISLMHNAIAALLLLLTITIIYNLSLTKLSCRVEVYT